MEELDAFEILKTALQRIACGRRQKDKARRIPRYELVDIAQKALFECKIEWTHEETYRAFR